MPLEWKDLEIREEFRSPEMRRLMIAYLDILRFQQRLTTRMREASGEPIRLLDTVVNLEVFLFPGSLQQEILDSLDTPRSSARDSLARLVRAGLVTREGNNYAPSSDTLGFVDEESEELMRLLFRLCDASAAFQSRWGR